MDAIRDRLSPRERMIAERYADGATYKQIAEALHIAPSTVRNHLAAVYRKLDVSGKPALIRALAGSKGASAESQTSGDSNAQSVAKDSTATASSSPEKIIGLADQGPVHYCASSDGVSIAHARVGNGYPILVGGSWMTHLEKDWENPGYGHYLSRLARDFTLIRYDQRGNGMSDWDDVEISFERMVDDLACVIDSNHLETVAIYGASQAASVAIAYACNHPGRVSHLVLHGGYPRGRRRRGDPDAAAESEALVTLIHQGWGRDNPAYRQTITSMLMPEASQEEEAWFNAFQKACGPGKNIARFREIFDAMDVSHLLQDITVPTLVIHCVGDSVAPLSEGKLLASRIPGAQFVTLNSDSHMMFAGDPEFPRFLESIRNFLLAK